MKLCLNPLSRVNSILIQACHIACRHIYQCLNPLSRVNSILILTCHPLAIDMEKLSQSPKSGQFNSDY